ncbi:putative sulfate transporter 3.4 [Platanthera guangdongensis]|uniref:Sulfate transporter 3.4 n=1 Tax=Platanthera guangdongensis TaxID=2320717 RepID=A0ABR2MC01_9ASPA
MLPLWIKETDLNIQQYREAVRVPGFVIVRIDCAIHFSNSIYVNERDEFSNLADPDLLRRKSWLSNYCSSSDQVFGYCAQPKRRSKSFWIGSEDFVVYTLLK